MTRAAEPATSIACGRGGASSSRGGDPRHSPMKSAANARRTRTTGRSTEGGRARTSAAPASDPTSPSGKVTRARAGSTRPARENRMSAANEPKTDWPLFVPSARCGGRPTARKTGSVTSPPPPAIAAMVPAARATATSSAICAGPGSLRGERVPLHRGEDLREADRLVQDLRLGERRVIEPAARRHDHDGDVAERLVAELLRAELPTVHARHHEVEQDEAGADAVAEEVERGPAVLEQARRVALVDEELADDLAEIGVVVDDEDGGVVVHRGRRSGRSLLHAPSGRALPLGEHCPVRGRHDTVRRGEARGGRA